MGFWRNPTNLDPKAKAEADTVYTLAKANGDSLAIALTQYAAPVVENGPQAILGNEDIFDKVSSNVQNETDGAAFHIRIGYKFSIKVTSSGKLINWFMGTKGKPWIHCRIL